MPALLLAGLLLTGCSQDATDAYWLQGAGYRWNLFNHRVSHIEWGVDADGPTAAVIGGTSTTGVVPELADTCDPDTCDELPFLDESQVDLRWVHATSDKVVFARGSVTVVADSAGGQETLTVALPRKAKGDPVAIIGGLSMDTVYPLSGGEACYNPAYGWHPRQMMVSTGGAVLSDDSMSVDVTVSALFEAGNSLEDIRQCIDEVADQAQVPVVVDVVVAVSRYGIEQIEVAHELSYEYGDGPARPAEQPDPDLASRGLDVSGDSPVVGWSGLHWSFYGADPDGRGAYLRTLSFDADAGSGDAAGYASGHATNYSPITQLSGFDYAFSGTVTAIEMPDGSAEGGLAEAVIPAELEDDGTVVVFDLDE